MSVRLYQDIKNGSGLPASITTAAGVVAVNTTPIRGELVYFYVKATTAATTFDVKFTDKNGIDVWIFAGYTGVLRELPHLDMVGKYTMTIYNASNNEAFDVFMRVKENI